MVEASATQSLDGAPELVVERGAPKKAGCTIFSRLPQSVIRTMKRIETRRCAPQNAFIGNDVYHIECVKTTQLTWWSIAQSRRASSKANRVEKKRR